MFLTAEPTIKRRVSDVTCKAKKKFDSINVKNQNDKVKKTQQICASYSGTSFKNKVRGARVLAKMNAEAVAYVVENRQFCWKKRQIDNVQNP